MVILLYCCNLHELHFIDLKKLFITNIIIAIIANLIIKPIWIFGIDKNMQLQIGHESYGQYASLLNLAIVFNYILDFGLTNYNNIEVAQHPEKLKGLFKNIFFAKLIFFLLFALVVVTIATLSGFSISVFPLLLVILLVQFLNSLLSFLRSNISGLQFYKMDTFLSILDKLLLIVFFGVLLFLPKLNSMISIHSYVALQALAYGIAIVGAFIFLRKHITGAASGNWQEIIGTIKKSAPYALLIFLMGLYMRSDLFY